VSVDTGYLDQLAGQLTTAHVTTPGFTPVSLSQIASTSGQLAQAAGSVFQNSNLVDWAVGSVQQLASMAQQGQEAAAPAENLAEEATVEGAVPEETTLAGNVDAAGAALGTEGAQRAPIDAGSQGAPQPNPAERVA
jgi:hypothetical protein